MERMSLEAQDAPDLGDVVGGFERVRFDLARRASQKTVETFEPIGGLGIRTGPKR